MSRLSKLTKIANHLDSLGLTKEADIIDSFIRKVAVDWSAAQSEWSLSGPTRGPLSGPTRPGVRWEGSPDSLSGPTRPGVKLDSLSGPTRPGGKSSIT